MEDIIYLEINGKVELNATHLHLFHQTEVAQSYVIPLGICWLSNLCLHDRKATMCVLCVKEGNNVGSHLTYPRGTAQLT